MAPLLFLFLYVLADASEGLLNVREARMAGGSATKDETYPFMTAVYRNGNYLCAGALVQNKYVLTAAHCFIDSTVSAFVLLLGGAREVSFKLFFFLFFFQGNFNLNVTGLVAKVGSYNLANPDSSMQTMKIACENLAFLSLFLVNFSKISFSFFVSPKQKRRDSQPELQPLD